MRENKDGTTGWNCGVDLGVAPQAKASHSSFQATRPIFVDARLSSNRDKKLADPPGYR